jgi:hypothetical protein
MRRKNFIVFGLIALLGFGLVYPFETTIVPAWKLSVTDENGVPYEELRVVEFWKHYSLELEKGMNGEERWTDRNGVVQFPRRTIRMSVLGRIARMTVTSINRFMHGSTGIHADIMATGPQGVREIDYEQNKPMPDRLVLPRHIEIEPKP